MRRFLIVAVLLALVAGCAEEEAASIDGAWEGAITVQGVEIAFSVKFATVDGELTGTMDIPAQMAYGLPLVNVSLEGTKVYFELDSPVGLATHDGRLEDGRITGVFSQAGAEGEFHLERVVPEEPPYDTEEVSVELSDEVTLAGTLSLPRTEGPHPAVVLITGSGPQNRDEEVFGFKIFKLIADHLTRSGIAVLRCDDRGVGGSTGGDTSPTTVDLADDVRGQMDYLKALPEIDPGRIGLLGHSEGSIIAGMVAAEYPDTAFIVLLGGPAYTGAEIVKAQLVLLSRAEGASEEEITENLELQERIFSALRAGEDLEPLKEETRRLLREALAGASEEELASVGDPEVYVESVVQASFAAVQSPWFRFFMDYDPAADLAKVTCPVLAVWGEFDLQVPAEENRARMEEVLAGAGHTDYTVQVFPGANHLFQETETGAFSEYALLPKEFVPGFLELVSGWLLPRVGIPQ
jgi:pimeloyl-ACP methyl ester carboxylesterase